MDTVEVVEWCAEPDGRCRVVSDGWGQMEAETASDLIALVYDEAERRSDDPTEPRLSFRWVHPQG